MSYAYHYQLTSRPWLSRSWPDAFTTFRPEKPSLPFVTARREWDAAVRGQEDSLSIFLEDYDDVECPYSAGVVKDFCAAVDWFVLETTWRSQKSLLGPQYPNIWHQDHVIDLEGATQFVKTKIHNGTTASRLLEYFECPVR
jgi:hypothetical protein